MAGEGGLCINDVLDDSLLDEIFIKLNDADRRSAIQVCRRWRGAFDTSHRLLTACFATFENHEQQLQWLRKHAHSVSFLNVDPNTPDEWALRLVATIHKRLMQLVITLSKVPSALPPMERLTHLDMEIDGPLPMGRVLAATQLLPELTHLRLDSRREWVEHIELPEGLLARGKLRSLVLSTDPRPGPGARTELTDGLSQLTALTELVLRNVGVRELPAGLGELAGSLETLAVAGSFGPLALPNEFSLLTSLRILQLEYCELQVLPREVLALTGLEKLSLEGNGLLMLPEEVGALRNLDALVLGHNDDLIVPDSVSALTRLTELDVHSCGLPALPWCVSSLTNLLDLRLSYNDIRALPEGPYLRGLTCLDLGSNYFDELPAALSAATALEDLLLDQQVGDVCLLNLASARQLLSLLPALKVFSAVNRDKPLKQTAAEVRDLWLDPTFDEAVALLRERGIEVQ